MLNKSEILKECVLRFEKQVHDLESAAKASAALATDAEHRAKSKYETFSLETSYLARGQAKRVVEMRETLSRLRSWSVKDLPADAEVQMGALVEVTENPGETQWYFLVPAGGGEEVKYGNRLIQLVTIQSPVAQVLMKKRAGDRFTVAGRTLRINAIC